MAEWLSLPKRERIERFSKKVVAKRLNLSNRSHQNDVGKLNKNTTYSAEETLIQNKQV